MQLLTLALHFFAAGSALATPVANHARSDTTPAASGGDPVQSILTSLTGLVGSTTGHFNQISELPLHPDTRTCNADPPIQLLLLVLPPSSWTISRASLRP